MATISEQRTCGYRQALLERGKFCNIPHKCFRTKLLVRFNGIFFFFLLFLQMILQPENIMFSMRLWNSSAENCQILLFLVSEIHEKNWG